MSAIAKSSPIAETRVRPPLSDVRALAGNMDASDVRTRLCGHGYLPAECPFGSCGYRQAIGRLRMAEQRAVDDRRAYTDAMVRRNKELLDYRKALDLYQVAADTYEGIVNSQREALKTYRRELDLASRVNRILFDDLVQAQRELEQLRQAGVIVEINVQVEPSDAAAQIIALQMEVASLREDRARLDWLLGSPEKNRLMDVSNGRSVPVTDRATLDAARFRRKELGDTAVL